MSKKREFRSCNFLISFIIYFLPFYVTQNFIINLSMREEIWFASEFNIMFLLEQRMQMDVWRT